VEELDAALSISDAELYRELPVALLARARDENLLDQLRTVFGDPPSPESLAEDDAVYIQGIIDLLVVNGDLATIVDYKTDRGVSAEMLKERYEAQLEWYCRAVCSLLPGMIVRWALYGLGGAGLVGPVAYQI
jgi:ATP-dependent exoDNAse (exonuclease V) beta subunit